MNRSRIILIAAAGTGILASCGDPDDPGEGSEFSIPGWYWPVAVVALFAFLAFAGRAVGRWYEEAPAKTNYGSSREDLNTILIVNALGCIAAALLWIATVPIFVASWIVWRLAGRPGRTTGVDE